MKTIDLDDWQRKISAQVIFPIVPFNADTDRIKLMDFTAANVALTVPILEDTGLFSEHVSTALDNDGAKFGVGGYNEHRTVYSRSRVFDAKAGEEPRRIHLGIDIWGEAGTPIFSPMDGVVHSFAFNNYFGDYGATIILQHQVDHFIFHTLYGHLSLKDIHGLKQGQLIKGGTQFAHFGSPPENGHWPPHLHLQIIIDMEKNHGDYPGVCAESKRAHYLSNCPDPDILLRLLQYAQ